MTPEERKNRGGLVALAFLLAVTVAWWMLALWPTASAAPGWLERARYVCFNAGPDGLPDASGWLLLIGQPIGMLAAMMVVWGDAVRGGVRALAARNVGRGALALVLGGLVVGIAAAAERVASAAKTAPPFDLASNTAPPETYPRLDRPAPELGFRDQDGELVDLEHLRGRPALVTFAFGTCETLCPGVIESAQRVRHALERRADAGELPREAVPSLVILTLDPWRDRPGRLEHIADHWRLDAGAHFLTGEVDQVEAALDAWGMARSRDTRTGAIVHPPLVYIVDAEGRIAYASRGDVETLEALLARL